MTRLTLIENLDVGDLNAEGNSLTAGASILPTGICGFGHWLQRQCAELGEVDGVAVAVHDFHRHEGMTKNPMALHGFARDKIINPPIVQELKADARVSLILRHRKTATRLPEVADAVRARLLGASFCGGRCHSTGFVGSFEAVALEDGSDNKPLDYQALQRRIRSWHPRGLAAAFLKDRADLIAAHNQIRAEQGLPRDDLDAVLQATLLFVERDADHLPVRRYRQHQGWVVPVAIGFQAIETPSHTRPGRRDADYPHVYAEPITGLAEFITHPRALRGGLLHEDSGFYWRYRHLPATATFYVTAIHQENHNG